MENQGAGIELVHEASTVFKLRENTIRGQNLKNWKKHEQTFKEEEKRSLNKKNKWF